MHEKIILALRSYAGVRLLTQVISWVGTVIVVRLLDSRAFGAFGLALVVYNYLSMVFDGTLLETFVQRAPASTAELRGVFTVTVGGGIALAAIAVALASAIARLVADPAVAPLIWVVGAALALTSFCMLPHATLARRMDFRRLARIAAAQSVCSTVATVLLAWLGAGAWALAGGLVLGVVTRLVLLNAAVFRFIAPTVHLRPALAHLKVGGMLFVDNMLWRWYTSLDTFLLGRWTGITALGFYSLAQQVAELPLEKISTVVNDVSLPAYARLSRDRPAAAKLVIETVRMHALVGFPIFWGLAAVAHSAVPALFGVRWHDAVFPLAALAAIAPIRLIGSIETPAMTGLGCPAVLVKTKLIIAPCMTAALIAGVALAGVNGVAAAWLLFPLCYAIAFRLVLSAIGVSYLEIFSAIRGPLMAAALMVLVLQFWDAAVQPLALPPAHALVGEMAVGAFCYVVLLRFVDGGTYRLARDRLARFFRPTDT